MTRFRPALLLAGALLLLASLYLPWAKASCSALGNVGGLRNLTVCPAVAAWSSPAGDAAALSALLLGFVAAAALGRPGGRHDRLLSVCALLAGYFGLALGAATHSVAYGEQVHFASGAYVGGAGAIVVLAAAAAARRWTFRRAAGLRLVSLAVAAGLLAALVLPWARVAKQPGVTFLGIGASPAVLAGVLTLCLVAGRGNRLAVAAAAALFTGAAFGSMPPGEERAYGAWAALGLALALVALALPGVWISRPQRPPAFALAVGAAAALLVASLFLPWQRECYPGAHGFCISVNGWSVPGTASAALALALGFFLLAQRRRSAPLVELAAVVGLLVATLGFELVEGTFAGVRLSFGYGSTLGFAAAALLVAIVLARVRPPKLGRDDAVRLLPVAACAGYAAIVVLPWWGVLSFDTVQTLRFAPLSWLTIAGVLVDLCLLGHWARRCSDVRLVLMPLALLALAALELIRFRDLGIAWGGGTIVGLCLLLAFLGRVEQGGGWANVHVPEILRVDRL